MATILVKVDLELHLGTLQEPRWKMPTQYILAALSDSQLSPIHNSKPPWATLDLGNGRPLSEYLLLQGIMKKPFMSFIWFNPTASDIKYRSCMGCIGFLHTLRVHHLRKNSSIKATRSPSVKSQNLQITKYLESQSSEALGNGAVLPSEL